MDSTQCQAESSFPKLVIVWYEYFDSLEFQGFQNGSNKKRCPLKVSHMPMPYGPYADVRREIGEMMRLRHLKTDPCNINDGS